MQQGIQWTPTEFKSLTGPEDEVRYAVNDEMQLSWEFEGFGETFCFLDGKLFHNSGEFGCRPPLNVQLPDRHNHTLRVIMQVSFFLRQPPTPAAHTPLN